MRPTLIIALLTALFSLTLVNSVIIADQSVDIVKNIMERLLTSSSPHLFEAYHFLFNKPYEINSEEGKERKQVFETNVSFIKSTNEKNLPYKLGINEFTDMSREEFKATYLTIKKEDVDAVLTQLDENIVFQYTEPFNSPSSLNIGAEISLDWTGHFRPAISQGSCGSCWAFATTAAIEGNYNIAFPHTNKVGFSPQSLVDCDSSNSGCNGGNLDRAMKHVIAKGLPYEYSYVYKGFEQTCPLEIQESQNDKASKISKNSQFNLKKIAKVNNESAKVVFNKVVSSYERCKHCTTEQYRGLLSKGPLSVFIDGEGNGIFQHYSSGVLEMPCSEINHCVNVVGVEADAEGNGFYRGRNSWGTKWGEDGYFRLKIGNVKESCYLEYLGVLPLVVEAKEPIPDPPEPECAKIFSQCNLSGNVYDVCESSIELPADVADSSKSFSVGKFTRVRLFSDVKCTGSSNTRTSNWTCIPSTSKNYNSIKSIMVGEEPTPPENCVWLYEESCFIGEKLEACSSITNLASVGWANRIGSIAVGNGIEYRIQSTTHYTVRSTNSYGLSSSFYKKIVKLTITPKS